jgi:hypothetical protein
MKKYLLILFVLFSATAAFAQHGAGAIKLGAFCPSSTDNGFIVGYEHSNIVDANFRFGWSVDWFHVNYTDKKLVGDYTNFFGHNDQVNELRAKTNLHDFPVQLTATANFPVAPNMDVYAIGGIGAEILLINYRNFENPDEDEFKAAFSFNWRIGAGFSYAFSKRADIFGELTYHSATPSWDYEVNDPVTNRTRTYEREFDMSGMMFRVGLRFFY